MKLPLLFVLLFAAWPRWADAGLDFEEQVLNLRSTPGEHAVDGVFRFRNGGENPVTIRKVHTTCGCTTAKLEKMTFAPGEDGRIETRFKYWYEKGALRKLLWVELEDGTRIDLEMRVLVKQALEVKPALVLWRLGSEPAVREVRVAADSDLPVKIRSVKCDSDAFDVALEEAQEGQLYKLKVRPASTARAASGKILVTTDYPPDKPETFTIYARVK